MHVLVVDDEEMIVEYVKRSLVLDGHKVTVAFDGAEALVQAAENVFDAVVLDIVMPKLDGLSVCRQLREQGVDAPVIMLSTKSTVADRVTGLDSGADDYLSKPFTYAELSARLRALQRRPKDLLQRVIQRGDLKIEPNKRQVSRNGVSVTLTSKEFDVLEYLLQYDNRAVSRTELLQKIWGVDAERASNRVEVCIKSLRQKLEAGQTSRPIIRTIRNFGYIAEVDSLGSQH